MANILSIGQTALTAAQVGLTTTGHNIANATTEGYSRQQVIQGNVAGQQRDFGFVGSGTEVTTVRRVYNEFLASQVLNSQTSQNALSSHYTQIKQINNMFADSTVGVSPALKDFFAGVQNLAAAPPASSGAARQTLISSAQTLAGQFQDVDARLSALREGVNSDIQSSIVSINSIATQIAKLNQAISTVQASNNGQPANDLLDQRDKLVSDLSKEIKVSVVKQGNDYNISIGNGQSLVVGGKTFELTPVASATDPSRLQVGYKTSGDTISLAEASLTGGRLGGLLEFRSQTLDRVQNEFGRIAISLASEFNAQHRLGLDLNGDRGGDFFRVGAPQVNGSTHNSPNVEASASIVDASKLTASDYRFEFVAPGNFKVTRLADGASTTNGTAPMSMDGLEFNVASGPLEIGDVFLVRPTIGGAAGFGVALSDPALVAAAAGPVHAQAGADNASSATVRMKTISSAYSAATFASPGLSLTYDAATSTLSGFPALPVTVTLGDGTTSTYAAGTPVPYTAGASISFGGVSLAISGTPADGDTFSVGATSFGIGDNRNALLLGALQTDKLLDKGSATLQGVFGQMVNLVGNKTHELDVNMTAENSMLEQAIAAHRSESGVNLDEEAANLLRYQQAYQAAGKVMQTASKMFDVLLSLGQ